MYRWRGPELQVLLGHPGGPVWEHRELGAWTIFKGEIEPGEPPFEAALREFHEETSLTAEPPYLSLGFIVQKSGKQVWAWASQGDADPSKLFSNSCRMQWPKKSGTMITVPEIDRYGWFSIKKATVKMNPAQAELLTVLLEKIGQHQPK